MPASAGDSVVFSSGGKDGSAMIPSTTLSDGTVTLRPFRITDDNELFGAVRESLADLKRWLAWAHDAYSLEEARAFITQTRSLWLERDAFAFAVTDAHSDRLIGGCGLSSLHPAYHFCNLGYWVRSSRRGEGIAGKAARLAARFAFEKLGMARVEVVIAAGNEASLRAAAKMGLQREGLLRNRISVDGRTHDALMFAFVPEDFKPGEGKDGLLADRP
jgi:RimJ/RimL family protein N-acetyltransferase